MTNLFIHGLGQAVTSWQQTLDQLTFPAVAVPNLEDFLSQEGGTYQELYQNFAAYCMS